MYDQYEEFEGLNKEPFTFLPSRYEIWMKGKMINSGNTKSLIISRVIVLEGCEKVEISFKDNYLNNELAQINIFDEYRTSNDRLQLITIPLKSFPDYAEFNSLRAIIGCTRQEKNFNYNEAYCCNLFTINNIIEKITFAFSNPIKLIEFYS